MTEQEYLDSAAAMVGQQAASEPGLAVPADPDVAEHMGIVEETAITPGDYDAPGEREGE